jgi:heme-degrading monooxygenase HmoA
MPISTEIVGKHIRWRYSMLARVGRFKLRPDQIEEGLGIIRNGMPAIQEFDGARGSILLRDNQSANAMTIAFWEDERAANESASAVADLFRQAAHAFEGQLDLRVYEVIEHDPGQNRRFARASAATVQPGFSERPRDRSIIDAAREQPGYAGFLILLQNDQLLGMSFWDSLGHLEASESGYYTGEMEHTREQFEGGRWERTVYEVVAQA